MKKKYSSVDIHTHILPGLDDGVQEWDESLRMAVLAEKAGTVKLFATPHRIKGVYDHSPSKVREVTGELQNRIRSMGLQMEVLPGEEVHLDADLAGVFDQGGLQTLGDSNFILLELPFDMVPQYTSDVLFQLGLRGVRVILAHPERNQDIQSDLDLLREFIRLGVFVQINAGSLMGVYGRGAEATAIEMVKKDMIDFIGSDAHSGKSASVLGRGPDMRNALDRLCRYSPRGEKVLEEIRERSCALIDGTLQ